MQDGSGNFSSKKLYYRYSGALLLLRSDLFKKSQISTFKNILIPSVAPDMNNTCHRKWDIQGIFLLFILKAVPRT